MSNTAVASTKTPRTVAGKSARALEQSRRILAEKQSLGEERRLKHETLSQGEAAYDILAREIRTLENEKEHKRWQGRPDRVAIEAELEEKKAQLKAAGEALTPAYQFIEQCDQTFRQHDAKLRDLAVESLPPVIAEAKKLEQELGKLNELETALQSEQAEIQSNCAPDDEEKLGRLEKIQLRLSVIPGYRAKLEEKSGALMPTIVELWRGAKSVLETLLGPASASGARTGPRHDPPALRYRNVQDAEEFVSYGGTRQGEP